MDTIATTTMTLWHAFLENAVPDGTIIAADHNVTDTATRMATTIQQHEMACPKTRLTS
jgi:hypothetical protein